MAIYPDKKNGKLTGRFRVEVQLKGQRKRGRFDSIQAAREADALFTKQLQSGDVTGSTRKFTQDRSRPHTLSEAIRRASGLLWVGKSVETNNFSKLEFFADVIGKETPIDNISTESVDKLTKALIERDAAEATFNRYYSACNVFLKWCQDRGYRTKPLPTFEWRDEDEGRIRWLSYDEEAQIAALGRLWLPKLVKVAVATGMRRSELLDLTPEQVHPVAVYLWETKNGDNRTIPITQDTYADLMALLAMGMPSKSQLRYEWDRVKKLMGLEGDEDFVFHACRHTFATRHIQANTNIRVLQRLMGHRRIETTMRYSHVSDDVLIEAVMTAHSYHNRKGCDRGLIQAHNFEGDLQVGDTSAIGPLTLHRGEREHRETKGGRGGIGRRAGFRFQSDSALEPNKT